jgi:hypothetical protein
MGVTNGERQEPVRIFRGEEDDCPDILDSWLQVVNGDAEQNTK